MLSFLLKWENLKAGAGGTALEKHYRPSTLTLLCTWTAMNLMDDRNQASMAVLVFHMLSPVVFQTLRRCRYYH